MSVAEPGPSARPASAPATVAPHGTTLNSVVAPGTLAILDHMPGLVAALATAAAPAPLPATLPTFPDVAGPACGGSVRHSSRSRRPFSGPRTSPIGPAALQRAVYPGSSHSNKSQRRSSAWSLWRWRKSPLTIPRLWVLGSLCSQLGRQSKISP